MPSAYLQGADLAAYGVPTATAPQITQASSLIDVFCRRPRSGFVWAPDAAGAPAYMVGATADMTWTSAASISAGANVVCTVTGPPLYPELIGRTVTLDVGNAGAVETCIISAINMPTLGTVTLGTVQFAHAGPVSLQSGLQIFEERYLPEERSIARVAQWPVVRVISGLGRYSYGRRSQQVQGNYSEFNLLAILQQFGGPPVWVPFDTQQLGLNPLSGELWVPAGLLLAYYSDARFYYIAGYSQANLPTAIKQACANIVTNLIGTAGTGMQSSLIKRVAAGGSSIERFADVAIDAGTQAMITPFRAHLLF